MSRSPSPAGTGTIAGCTGWRGGAVRGSRQLPRGRRPYRIRPVRDAMRGSVTTLRWVVNRPGAGCGTEGADLGIGPAPRPGKPGILCGADAPASAIRAPLGPLKGMCAQDEPSPPGPLIGASESWPVTGQRRRSPWSFVAMGGGLRRQPTRLTLPPGSHWLRCWHRLYRLVLAHALCLYGVSTAYRAHILA